jgi:hypothetical protein
LVEQNPVAYFQDTMPFPQPVARLCRGLARPLSETQTLSYFRSINYADIVNKNEERQQQEGILNPNLQTSSLTVVGRSLIIPFGEFSDFEKFEKTVGLYWTLLLNYWREICIAIDE